MWLKSTRRTRSLNASRSCWSSKMVAGHCRVLEGTVFASVATEKASRSCVVCMRNGPRAASSLRWVARTAWMHELGQGWHKKNPGKTPGLIYWQCAFATELCSIQIGAHGRSHRPMQTESHRRVQRLCLRHRMRWGRLPIALVPQATTGLGKQVQNWNPRFV